MIFITTGTTDHPFNRMDTIVQRLTKIKNEKIIYQSRNTTIQTMANLTIISELPYHKLVKYIKSADTVITHGGPASIYLAAKFAKNKPFVLPRLNQFEEHVNNHQLYFTQFINRKGFIRLVNAPEEVLPYQHSQKKLINKISSSKTLHLLVQYLKKTTDNLIIS